MPKEHFGSSKRTYFGLQNINTKPFVLLSKSLGCHANEQHVTWEWKAGNDIGQKLVIVLQLTQCNNYGWEPRSGTQTCRADTAARSGSPEDAKRLTRTLTVSWLDRKGWTAHTWAGFTQPRGTFSMENRSAGCKTSVRGLFSSTNSPGLLSAGREATSLFWHRIMENFHSVTQEWLLSFWTGNICDGEVSAAPRISSWYLWRRVGSYFEAMTWDLKYLEGISGGVWNSSRSWDTPFLKNSQHFPYVFYALLTHCYFLPTCLHDFPSTCLCH